MQKLLVLAAFICALPAHAITREEALRTAESYLQCHWQALAKNLRHGKDARGIDVQTPDRDGNHCSPLSSCWLVGAENVGVAYKWGGYDTPATFLRGVDSGKAAGDIYTAEKRRLDDGGVSDDAVGVDCSGFVCRSWKTAKRYSTATLADVCRKLPSVSELQPADAMNQPGGHVLLFVKWLDAEKTRALFYEAAPFSKTLASEHAVKQMVADGFVPLRYRHISP